MHRKYLGDAFDFWKGSMLEVLRVGARPAQPSPLAVLPMLTDGGWTESELSTYASLLRVPREAILAPERFVSATRAEYFASARVSGADVFLDPDTGVGKQPASTAHVRAASTAHVLPGEVAALAAEQNVVAVYQHAPRLPHPQPWARVYVERIQAMSLNVAAYVSPGVAMLFASRSADRVERVRYVLRNTVGTAGAEDKGRNVRVL